MDFAADAMILIGIDGVQPVQQVAKRREELIMEHLPQVKMIARRIHDRLPVSVNLEDLISSGIIGLIAAIDRFHAQHGVKLRTYAEYKIRGAILDSLRELDWVPRQQRRRSRLIATAIAQLEQDLQRLAKDDEIADFLGLSINDYHDWLWDARVLTFGSVDSSGSEDDRGFLRHLADIEENWPSQVLERAELERVLAVAIERMPKIHRTVLGLYYYEEMTLREISKVVGLHESRVSQLKSQAVLRLRSILQKRWVERPPKV